MQIRTVQILSRSYHHLNHPINCVNLYFIIISNSQNAMEWFQHNEFGEILILLIDLRISAWEYGSRVAEFVAWDRGESLRHPMYYLMRSRSLKAFSLSSASLVEIWIFSAPRNDCLLRFLTLINKSILPHFMDSLCLRGIIPNARYFLNVEYYEFKKVK